MEGVPNVPPFESPLAPNRVNPVGDRPDQEAGTGRFARKKQDKNEDKPAFVPLQPPPSTVASEPTPLSSPLLEALDRLRATQAMRPVDLEFQRLLRGTKAYQSDGAVDGGASPTA